jgi:acetyltransferase-like isoleucine patch superfamily enzyme
VGHLGIDIGPDVFFGPNVYVTDQNHGTHDPELPIGRQSAPERRVVIGAGSWIGTNAVILPGVCIGERVIVGAGSVVTTDVPDGAVAVGAPARVLGDV